MSNSDNINSIELCFLILSFIYKIYLHALLGVFYNNFYVT